MKDSSDVRIEKPFCCDIDGCSMKFANEDHLMVHKKRHDMVLNIGSGPKGSNFSDQTPTPTRFIRNCEEVGLFQDLQYVNPFEETFRKAVEAAKSGQAPAVEKSFQSNPTDDTLHTPNVFPHITDLPCRNSGKDLASENARQTGEEEESKKEDSKDLNVDEEDLIVDDDVQPQNLVVETVSETVKDDRDKHAIEVAENNDCTWLMNPSKSLAHEYGKSAILNNYDNAASNVHAALREKIKSNMHNKQVPVILQLKVPIPRATSTGLYQKLQKDSFSTFSKNSLKYEAKLEKPQSGIFDLSKKRRVRKNSNCLQKERLEILERNRAAATRCREKKKIYVSYLEKLNRDLTAANKNLHVVNTSLKRQISVLQAELSKHKDCPGLPQTKAETAVDGGVVVKRLHKTPCENETVGLEAPEKTTDIVEVSLYDENIFSIDEESATVASDVEVTCIANSELYPNKGSCQVQNLKKFYTDHSYFNDASGAVPARRKVIRPKPVPSFATKEESGFRVADVALDKNVLGVLIPASGNEAIFHAGGNSEIVFSVDSVSNAAISPLKSIHKRKCMI